MRSNCICLFDSVTVAAQILYYWCVSKQHPTRVWKAHIQAIGQNAITRSRMIVTAADTAAVAAASDIVNVDAVYDADNNAITAWTRRVQATMPEFILSAAHT